MKRISVIDSHTAGDAVPAKAKHDWNLGPTGLRGWMFCDKLVTTDARQIAITAVDQGSPADAVIAVGDVLLGVGGNPFSCDPRAEMGRAITAAEREAGGGRLALTRWRAGQAEEVTVKLPVLGTFSATAPYDCPKSQRILNRGLKALAARMAQPDYAKAENAIPRTLNALALLAGGDAAHQPLVKREAQWAADFTTPDFKTWYYGYVMIFLAEFITATGDASVLPGLRRLAMEAAGGQSAVGSWGHTFALLDSANLNARIGACHALEALRGAAAPAVPQLRRALQHDDLWLRVRAATGLAVMGKPALPALFERGEKNFPKDLSERKAKAVRQAIERIEAAQDRPALKRLPLVLLPSSAETLKEPARADDRLSPAAF